jgi:hypothetical protein
MSVLIIRRTPGRQFFLTPQPPSCSQVEETLTSIAATFSSPKDRLTCPCLPRTHRVLSGCDFKLPRWRVGSSTNVYSSKQVRSAYGLIYPPEVVHLSIPRRIMPLYTYYRRPFAPLGGLLKSHALQCLYWSLYDASWSVTKFASVNYAPFSISRTQL